MPNDLVSKLFLFIPLLLSLVAIASVAMAASSLKAARAEVGRWEDVIASIGLHVNSLPTFGQARAKALLDAEQLSRELAAQKAVAEQNAQAAAAVAAASANAQPSSPSARTDLEMRVEETQNGLKTFLNKMERWSIAAGTSLDELRAVEREMHKVYIDLSYATDMEEVKVISQRVAPLLPDLLSVLIRKTDRDLDPQQQKNALQAALGEIVNATGMCLIEPKVGELFDSRLHRRLGIVPGTLEQRGRVGQVKCRGLKSEAGELIEPAEVLEYD